MRKKRPVVPQSSRPPETFPQEWRLPREIAEPAVEMAIAFWRALVSREVCVVNPLDPEDPLLEIKEKLAAIRAKWQADFEDAAERSRPLLRKLAEKGAEPVYVLAFVIIFARRTGRDFPVPWTIKIKAGEFEVIHPGGVAALWRDEHVRSLRALKRIAPRAAGKERGGRPGNQVTAGMALLARHLQQTTGWHQYSTVAELFRIWAPDPLEASPLDGERVRRRVNRAEREPWFPTLVEGWADGYHRMLVRSFYLAWWRSLLGSFVALLHRFHPGLNLPQIHP